jgi:DNA gyrase/topoisomerase IV subunit B
VVTFIILTFSIVSWKELIDLGYVYVAQPFYLVKKKDQNQNIAGQKNSDVAAINASVNWTMWKQPLKTHKDTDNFS